MDQFSKKNIATKEKLDRVSDTFCLAKWTQTTIHLGLGHTHSCHHPRTHKISVEDLKIDPSTLHNTTYKKQVRKEMLNGVRSHECEYCWKVEDLKDAEQHSDRILKSSADWSMLHFEEVLSAGYEKNINPKYLEISFSNVCNFKCSYCMPSVSSQWMEEIERHGAYPTSGNFNNLEWVKQQDKFPIPVRQYNPYVEAFWQWFPSLIKDLHTFRITGGEPLLDKNTFKCLDYIIENPQPNLELSINSNFDVPDELFDKFLQKVNFITENKLVKSFTAHTSCEAHGAAAEYIRFGLNYNRWKANVRKFIDNVSNPHLGIMSTYNCLSVTTYQDFLNDILSLKQQIKNKNGGYLSLDIPYLNHPYHQSIKILTDDFSSMISDQINFCKNNIEHRDNCGFNEIEIFKLLRVESLFLDSRKNRDFDFDLTRKDFYKFVDEHDRRRNTNFLKTFPKMSVFYQYCKSL
jgi:organic radical activating enzyme